MRNLNEMENDAVSQLELAIAGQRNHRLHRQRRTLRANWWFAQMRRVVDHAVPWPPPPGRPEQVHMALVGGHN